MLSGARDCLFRGFDSSAGNCFVPPRINFAMASTLRLPVAASRNVTQPCLTIPPQARPFSQSSQQWAAGGRAVNFRPPGVAQPSFKTRTQGMKLADLPNDIGLLPGTFVRPLWSDMPSIFSAPKDRLHMEWTWLKSLFGNYTRSVDIHAHTHGGIKCINY